MGALVPLGELDYKRLTGLARLLAYALPHAAGANPRLGRAYASVHAPWRHRAQGEGGKWRPVLDGPLLGRYSVALSAATQASLAESAGSSAERVLESLRWLDWAAHVF